LHGCESVSEAGTHFSGEQTLLICHTLLRRVFFTLGNFRAAGAAPVGFQWQRSTDVELVVTAIHFFEPTKSERWILT
jgi:hypothetical protein